MLYRFSNDKEGMYKTRYNTEQVARVTFHKHYMWKPAPSTAASIMEYTAMCDLIIQDAF